jgi:hypothetical protein
MPPDELVLIIAEYLDYPGEVYAYYDALAHSTT